MIGAIQKYPEYMGGTMDFSSRVTGASEGQALIKTGAEGVFAGVLFEKRQAFALKALDGQTRASQAAVHYLLNHWGVAGIEGLGPSEIRNWNNEVVGSVRVCEKRL
jgi:L-asparaginase II